LRHLFTRSLFVNAWGDPLQGRVEGSMPDESVVPETVSWPEFSVASTDEPVAVQGGFTGHRGYGGLALKISPGKR
jgi:hypothetical protein